MTWKYVPGQAVVLRGNLGQGRIMGSTYAGPAAPLYRVERNDRPAVEGHEGAIASAGPVPEYEIGERVRVRWWGLGTVVAKAPRTDAPGFFYTVEIRHEPPFDVGGPVTTTVGAEHLWEV